MKINPITIKIAEYHFEKFSESALAKPQMPLEKFLHYQKKTESDFRSISMLETWCDKLSELVNKLLKVGNLDLAGIICSRLAKFTNLPTEIKEKYIKQGLEIAELQGDKFHTIARLECLHKEYKKNGNTEKLRKVLVREESELKEVITNFDELIKTYKSINEKEKDVENYKDLLATAQIDLANVLLKSDPKKAIKKLKSAIEILNTISNDRNRTTFAKMLLKFAKKNLYGDKYLEF